MDVIIISSMQECENVVKHCNLVVNTVQQLIFNEYADKNGQVPCNKIFEIQSRFRKSGMREYSQKVLQACRKCGFDVKINMQDYNLTIAGVLT